MRLILALLLTLPLWGANGDITAIRVVGSTTAVADATSACNTASACTGWVAEVDVAGLSTGGTYALGIGTNNSPTNAKLVCTVTSSGYSASAVLGTTTRTVYGTHQLRRIYNAAYTAPYPSDETVTGGTLTLRIALSDALYQGDTATCSLAAGAYTQGGTPTNAASNVTVTNNSTLTYSQARVIAAWSWPGWSRITGNTLTVRAVGFHRHAKNGKPLAAMKFTATDQHSHTATVTVTDMTIDAGMPDPVKVPEYIGNLNVSGFTQGDLVTVNFAGYPWVGDATSVLDTSDGVNAMPSPNYAPQYYIMDAAGTYGTAAAVVDLATGNDSTCQAVAESAFNGSSDAATLNPCATPRGAGVKIRAWDVANTAHADIVGTIYLKAGNYDYGGSTASIAASSGTNYDSAWLTVTPFPGVARSSVVITTFGAAPNNKVVGATGLQKLKGLTIAVTSGTVNIGSAKYIWFDDCSLLMTSGTSLAAGTADGVAYYTHNTVPSGGVKNGFTSYSDSAYPALIRGNDVSNLANSVSFFTAIGNVKAPSSAITVGAWNTADSTSPASIAPILAYNKFTNMQVAASFPTVVSFQNGPLGAVVAQNVFEYNSSGITYNYAGIAGGTSATPNNNIMLWYNTLSGGRANWCYNDTGSTPLIRTLWSTVGSIFESRSIKTDTFTTADAGRVGNWSCEYGVGSYGVVDSNTGTSSNTVGVSGFRPEFGGIWSTVPSIAGSIDAQATSQPPISGAMNAPSWLAFTSRAGWDGVSQGAGNGDYHIGATSPARSLIPSGMAVLPYDLDGQARKNDGTGAAGAYEYVSSGGTVRHRIIQ